MALKQIDELNISDLLKIPVWEFALKEMKEQGVSGNFIKPSEQTAPYSPHKARILVRATFTLKDGTSFKGHIQPIDLLNSYRSHLAPADLFPVIVTLKGPVIFWYENVKPTHKRIAGNYRVMGKYAGEIFPIRVQSDVAIDNGIGEGLIPGFLYCDERSVEDFFNIKESEIKIVK
jgi:hypothetical protein